MKTAAALDTFSKKCLKNASQLVQIIRLVRLKMADFYDVNTFKLKTDYTVVFHARIYVLLLYIFQCMALLRTKSQKYEANLLTVAAGLRPIIRSLEIQSSGSSCEPHLNYHILS